MSGLLDRGMEMEKIFFDLDFVDPDIRSSAGSSWISLRKHPHEENGSLHVTHLCAGFDELDWQITQMQKELEEIRKKARAKYSDAAGKPRKPLSL